MRNSTFVNTDITSDLLELWKLCDGYYKCPETANGKLLGPLVGYAGTYGEETDKKHYVGKEYFNFAKVEEHHRAVDQFAATAALNFFQVPKKKYPTVVLAAPMGGIIFGQHIARRLDCRFIFAEKNVITASNTTERNQSTLKLDRHSIKPRDIVLIAEDVVNNFSTANDMLGLIVEAGAEPCGVISALNRCPYMAKIFNYRTQLPIVSALTLDARQYEQNHPDVSEHINNNNIVWKPKSKEGWQTLMTASMAAIYK